MRIGHPSRRSLRDWLLGAEDDKVEEHIGTCDQCAQTLEIIEAEESDLAVADALARALDPPPDFVDHLQQRVAARLDSRQVLGVMVDLFGAGFDTTKLLLSEAPHDPN